MSNGTLSLVVERVRVQQQMTWSQVADLAGYHAKGRPDPSRVKRLLGLASDSDGATRTELDSEDAARIVRAVGLDPVDVGL